MRSSDKIRVLSTNRKARFKYELYDSIEAGIVLRGSEIKSIRLGKLNIEEAYASPVGCDIYLFNSYIGKYEKAARQNHETNRRRKLLLNRREINKLLGGITKKGLTLIPVSIYLNSRNLVKIEIALARGKKLHDKRHVIQEREENITKRREFKRLQR